MTSSPPNSNPSPRSLFSSLEEDSLVLFELITARQRVKPGWEWDRPAKRRTGFAQSEVALSPARPAA
jgi:hypothetical protein